MVRLFGELNQRAVGQRIAADELRRVRLVVVFAEERDLDLGGVLDHVIVGEDEAVLADDEAGARGARSSARAGAGAPPPLPRPRAALASSWLAGSAEEAVEEVVRRCRRRRRRSRKVLRLAPSISVRMLTTIGCCALAMLRNVCASSAPVIGALFIGGTARVCADEAGVRSSRDAMTMPTASDATAISRRVEERGLAGGHRTPPDTQCQNLRLQRPGHRRRRARPTIMLISDRTPKSSK